MSSFLVGDKEPARDVGLSVTVITSIWVLVNSFWPNLITQDVQNAITTIALALIPLITGILIRNKVWSPASVQFYKNRIEDLNAELYRAKKASNDWD